MPYSPEEAVWAAGCTRLTAFPVLVPPLLVIVFTFVQKRLITGFGAGAVKA
ncbi:hypothetical protein ABT215_01315 [Streptomyces sp900105755]|uniref:hypothetical protein n=1 Tax=Streptomyces sp. 900105755 TaxID=3154389 RepID=UPI003333FE30